MGYEDLTGWKSAAAEGHASDKPTLLKEYLPDQIKAEGERKYTFTISTGAVDRDRDTVKVDGWQLDNYRKNPTVLWAHDYAGLPVGRSESIIARSGQLIARMEFVPGEVYPFAETVRQLVDGGFIKATSVGFRPLKWAFNEERGGVDFEQQELLEFSLVPVPSNPDALIEAKRAGLDVAPLKDWAIKLLDSYQLSDTEKADAARVLKLVTGEPVAVTVAGAPLEPIGASHAAEKSGDEPEPAIPVVEKRGRVLSASTEERIRKARGHGDELIKVLDEVLSQVEEMCDDDEDDDKSIKPKDDPPEIPAREPRLVVLWPQEPRKYIVNPESVAQAVRVTLQAEVRRLRGRLD